MLAPGDYYVWDLISEVWVTKLIITGEGVAIEHAGFNVSAPSKDIPVRNFLSDWFYEPKLVQIGWVNFLAEESWSEVNRTPKIESYCHESELTDLRNRAKLAERTVANLRGTLAELQGKIYPYPTPAAANGPGEIPKSEYCHVLVPESELTGLRNRVKELQQQSNAAQALWFGVSNECESLRSKVRAIRELLA